MSDLPNDDVENEQSWEPLGRHERRVLGVLVEKAKTTPEAYPLTLNSLTNGCNQKNNRYPQMDLEPVDVQNAMGVLAPLGAVEELASGRVEKYRHHITDWLGVSSKEAAIMAELLLRGAQTFGDLRGRANRMSPIASVAELRPLVYGLMHRGLILPLTEVGRGQIVTHNLYKDEGELSGLRRDYNEGKVVSLADQPKPKQDPNQPVSTAPAAATLDAPAVEPSSPATQPVQSNAESTAPIPVPAIQPAGAQSTSSSSEIAEMKQEIEGLKTEVQRLKSEVEDLWSNVSG